MSDNIKFGLAIPQGWRGGDFPLEEENDPVSHMNSQSLLQQQLIT
jgi:hypothetical protein